MRPIPECKKRYHAALEKKQRGTVFYNNLKHEA